MTNADMLIHIFKLKQEMARKNAEIEIQQAKRAAQQRHISLMVSYAKASFCHSLAKAFGLNKGLNND